MAKPDLLSTTDAAALLGVTSKTVRRWAETRRLRHVKLPSGQIRFHREDVLAALTPVEPEEQAS